MNDLTRDSDRLLSDSRKLLVENRSGGRHRRVTAIGRESAQVRNRHRLKKLRKTEGETVVTLLWDVLAAKGFEKNTYFCEVARLIGALPRLEGTVHVNVAQILKFMPNFMFNPTDYPPIGTRNDPADDVFFWSQGPARGASKVQFADWAPVYERHLDIPNVGVFYEQVQAFKELLSTAAPDADQQRDLDFVLVSGSARFKPTTESSLEYSLEWLSLDPDPEGESTWIHVVRGSQFFTTDLYVQAFLQTNTVIDRREAQVRVPTLRRPPAAGGRLACDKAGHTG